MSMCVWHILVKVTVASGKLASNGEFTTGSAHRCALPTLSTYAPSVRGPAGKTSPGLRAQIVTDPQARSSGSKLR